MKKIVAIDGPAGSGKGTIAKIIADKCNFDFEFGVSKLPHFDIQKEDIKDNRKLGIYLLLFSCVWK